MSQAHWVARRVAIALVPAALLGGVAPARAQVKGPNTCFKCHKQARSAWETAAPFHRKSLDQLSAPKAAGFAAAIGLPSPMTDTGKAGDCVSCHATLVGGAPTTGISCESCHGPGTAYFTPHQEPEFYDKPEGERLGLRDLFKKPAVIAGLCVNCHVTPDPRLKKAGHPAGEAFDAGKGLQKMVHWDSGVSAKRRRDSYDAAFFAQVGAEGVRLAARRLPAGGAGLAAAPAPAAGATSGPPARPAPAPGVAAQPTASAVAPRRPRAAAAADPFDWDQPVAELPADYPGDAGAAPPGANPPAAAAPAPAIAEAPRAPAPARPPRAPTPTPRAPSTAPELPVVPTEPVLPAATPVAAPAQPAAVALPATAQVAELRGRSARLLATLLKTHAAQLDLPPAAPPQEFQGPDGELLRIQDEILYLALEALRKPTP